MRILAIDTALPAVSVCVLDAGSSVPVARASIPMEKGHAEALMPLVARVMAQVEGGFASLGRIAVTVGPGSFTGIRIGVAAARGIALARGVEAVGVSTLAAFAAPLLSEESDGIVAAAIDARHGHVYFTAYGPAGRMLTSPRILALRDACRLLGAGRIRAVGSGAILLRDEARFMAATSMSSMALRRRISWRWRGWDWSPIPPMRPRARFTSRRRTSSRASNRQFPTLPVKPSSRDRCQEIAAMRSPQ